MNESNGKHKVLPHYRITPSDVRKDRLDGLLTAKGAIFYLVSASQKIGTPVRINPRKVAAELSISRTSFYDAIAKLKLEGRIDFEVEGDLIIRVSQSTIPDSQSTIPDSQSTIPDSQSTIPDSQSTIPDDLSTIPDDLSGKPENERLKSANSKRSGDSPINTVNTINSFKERERERDQEENDDTAFRNWLLNKANLLPQKPALMEQWIDKEMLKGANKREFAQYQATRVVTPIPAILPQENLSPQDYWAAVEARRNGNG